MHKNHPRYSLLRWGRDKSGPYMLAVLLLCTLIMSACGGSPQSQQAANQNKAQLDAAIQLARRTGIPASVLAPIVHKENQLSSTGAPFAWFNDQPDTDYYTSQANSYHALLVQTQNLVSTTTDQYSTQAQNDVQAFGQALSRRQSQHIGNLQHFVTQYNTDTSLLTTAQYAKDFMAISADANTNTQALGLMGLDFSRLATFKSTITQMQQAQIDVTAMQEQYQSDEQTLNSSITPTDFQNLNELIDAQYQLAVVNSIGSLPYVGAAKLGEFKAQLALLKTYGMDPSAYQKLYNADLAEMNAAKTIQDFLKVSNQIDADMSSMHNDLIQGASSYLIGALDREANAWGNAHLYHDKFDGHNYILDFGYTMNGIGYWLQRELGWAYYPADFQSVVNDENTEFFNFNLMQQDYNDPTPYNKVHATDMELLQHYNLMHSQVLVVSMVEQAMRVYQDGKLVNAFLVTMGRVERPALPGIWTVQNWQAPTEFKSTDPPSSPFWYPPTPINYAILYHWGGFFVHDAWWRVNFGPGTQFPHYDAGGDESFAGNGSHGCINMQEQQAAWVYSHTDWNTTIAVY